MKPVKKRSRRLPPGHVIFTSEEIEWLMSQLILMWETAKRLDVGPLLPPVFTSITHKIDRARFVDAVENLIPKTTRDLAYKAAKIALRK